MSIDWTGWGTWLFYQVTQQVLWQVALSIAAALGLTAAAQRGLGLLSDRKQTVWFASSIFVVAFLFFFAVWRTATPNLQGSILFISADGQMADKSNVPGPLSLAATITNIGGMQSIVRDWRLTATADGHVYEGQPFAVSEIVNIGDRGGTTATYFHANLVEHGLIPIAVGGQATGLLMFYFPKLPNDFFHTRNPTLILYFKDVLGRQYSVVQPMTAELNQITYTPGLNQQIRHKDEQTTGSTPKQ
jgi:hypothetical protein